MNDLRLERVSSGQAPSNFVSGAKSVASQGSSSNGLLLRLVDIGLSGGLIVGFAPVILCRGLAGWIITRRPINSSELVGRYRRPYRRFNFSGKFWGASLPVLFNILQGEMSFVGPHPMTKDEASNISTADEIRFRLKPGLYSPSSLRKKVGVDYETKDQSDRDLVYNLSLKTYLGVLLRSIIGGAMVGNMDRPKPRKLSFWGVAIGNITMEESLVWILKKIRAKQTVQVAFVNPDCLNIAYSDSNYHQILNQVALILPDGIGIHMGCRILGIGLRENVNGTDLFPRLCAMAVDNNLSFYLLGGKPGVAESVVKNMQQRYPGIRFSGTQHGYFKDNEKEQVIENINASGADILLVAFGVPKQEKWLAQHADRLKPLLRMGVGGLFDFYSGRIPRAPKWMRETGLEWTWRLAQEPGRMWRRYIIGNPLFLYRVFKQRMRGNLR